MSKRVYGCLLGACALVGCDQMAELPLDGRPSEGRAAVEGRMGAAAHGSGVEADAVVAITVDNVVLGRSPVVDGAWRIDGLAAMDGAFFVEGRADGALVGRVVIPHGAEADAVTVALPIDAESTAEAAVFELLATGEGLEVVDPVAVIDTVTAEMAATAERETLAAAVMAAQVAERAALEAHTGLDLSARWMSELRAGAFEGFAEAMNRAGEAGERAAALAAWQAESIVALEAGLGADAEARADAAAAAGFALVAGFDGEPGLSAALQSAGERAADAEAEVIDGLLGPRDEARARAEQAFADFAAALDAARTLADIQAAHDALFAALSGVGGAADSVVAAVLGASAPDIGSLGALTGGLDLASAVQITVDTRAALTVDDRDPEAAGRAFAELRQQARAEVERRLGERAPPEVIDVLSEVAVAGASLPSPARLEE